MPFKNPEVARLKNKEYHRKYKSKNPERMRLFYIWCQLRRRCTDSSHRQFKDYGGRGITFCERWQKFDLFLSDMGPRPEGGLLERKDNNAGYSPENCVWANRVQQNSNRRSCIYVSIGGENLTLKEACHRKGLVYRAVHKRIVDRGWEVDIALSVPIGKGVRYASVRRDSALA